MTGEDYEELKSRLAEQAMTHDPLCDAVIRNEDYAWEKYYPIVCVACILIARVREEERDRWIAFYSAEIEKQGVQWDASLRQRYREGSNDGKQLAYAAALRDATEAVAEAIIPYLATGRASVNVMRDSVAAIEALNNPPTVNQANGREDER